VFTVVLLVHAMKSSAQTRSLAACQRETHSPQDGKVFHCLVPCQGSLKCSKERDRCRYFMLGSIQSTRQCSLGMGSFGLLAGRLEQVLKSKANTLSKTVASSQRRHTTVY
jgi:hypothetical protein